MQRTNPRRSRCPISAALDVLGDRWSLLIVRDMLFDDARTFKHFLGAEERIATNVLTDRLAKLQSSGIITADKDADDGRRMIYRLSQKGLDLVPVVMELSAWGTRYEEGQPPDGILDAWGADKNAFFKRLKRKLQV